MPYRSSSSQAPVNGAGKLAAETHSAIPNSTITYEYDALGRASKRSINGQANSLSWVFDPLGRILQESSTAVGAFSFQYSDNSANSSNSNSSNNSSGQNKPGVQLSSVLYPNGQRTDFTYFDNRGDRRLEQITNLDPKAGLLSRYKYAYNAAGEITNWKQELGAGNQNGDGNLKDFILTYDAAGQLTGAQSTPSNEFYQYAYDAASNRTDARAAIAGTTKLRLTNATFNNLNQLTKLVTGDAELNQSQAKSKKLRTEDRLLSYDANGNLIGDGKNKYSWDAENRLHLIAYPGKGNSSQFDYDVLGRCEKITERSGGSITASKLLLWAGSEICEERDGAGVVTKQFFPLAYKSGGATYFYTTDHLGSKREVYGGGGDSGGSGPVDAGGGTGASCGAGGGGDGGRLQTRLAYSPYGEQTLLQRKDAPDFGYAGMYLHQRSGLNLTLFRQYDPGLGRWLSRDPIEESGGLNLYAYVGGNPILLVDPLGLFDFSIQGPLGIFGPGIQNLGDPAFDLAIINTSLAIASGGGTAAFGGAVTGVNAGTGATVAGAGATLANERYFRTMSEGHFEQLMETRMIPATAETFISPSMKFSSNYAGVLVEFEVAPGTTQALQQIGVRNRNLESIYPDLPLVKSGWTRSKAFFKNEGGTVNIGLGKGKALDTFNNNIMTFKRCKK